MKTWSLIITKLAKYGLIIGLISWCLTTFYLYLCFYVCPSVFLSVCLHICLAARHFIGQTIGILFANK